MEHGSNNQATALSYCPPPPWEQPSLLPALARGFLQICNSLPLDFSSCHPTSSPLLPAVPQDLRCPVASAYCLSSVALWLYSTTSAPTQLSLLELSWFPASQRRNSDCFVGLRCPCWAQPHRCLEVSLSAGSHGQGSSGAVAMAGTQQLTGSVLIQK